MYSIFFERETQKSHMWKCIKENNNVVFWQNQFDLNLVIPYKQSDPKVHTRFKRLYDRKYMFKLSDST